MEKYVLTVSILFFEMCKIELLAMCKYKNRCRNKVIISVLLSISIVLSEIPPPYPARGFRPSPAFNLPVRQPQTSYGVPNAEPSKFSVPSKQINNVPRQGQVLTPNLTPSFSSKQTIPSTSYGVPVSNNPYRIIISESEASRISEQQNVRTTPFKFNSQQTIPSTSYGVPVTTSPYKTIINEPQVSYGAPSRQVAPSRQYGVPDTKHIETLEQIRQLNALLQLSQSSNANQQNQFDINLLQSQNSESNTLIPSQQYLPIREPGNFKGGQSSTPQRIIERPSQQYLPVKDATDFRNGFNPFQSNIRENLDVRAINPSLRQQQNKILPVNQAHNFGKGVQFPQTDNPQLLNPVGNFQSNSPQRPGIIKPNPALQPQNLYNAPQDNIEIQCLNVRRLPSSSKIEPLRQKSGQRIHQNLELGDANIQGASREQIDEKYLPPSTTARSVPRSTIRPTLFPEGSSDEDEQSTGTQTGAETGGPNIAVATAVSGTPEGQNLYLLQPDGRLQKVIYQKTRSETDHENEYTANYFFQNVQTVPGLVYSPLIAVGKR